MQRLLLKRINRFLQRNRFQATELTFTPLLGLHPATDFGEQGEIREMHFYNVLRTPKKARNLPAEMGYHSRKRSLSRLISMASSAPEWAERRRLPAFGLGMDPSPDSFRQSLRPTLRRTAFLKQIYPPQALLRTVEERQLRPRSNNWLLQLPPKLAGRPKKWLSRWRQHLARVRRQQNLVKFLHNHLDPQMSKMRRIGRRRAPPKRFAVATNRGLQRHWRGGGLRRPLWVYGGGFSHRYPELSRDPNLWYGGGWRSPTSQAGDFMGRVARFGRRFFRRARWLRRRSRYYSLPQQLRQMNFSFASLARGVDVPRTSQLVAQYGLGPHPRLNSGGDYPSP